MVEDADRVDEVEAATLGRIAERQPQQVALHDVHVVERREVRARGLDGAAQVEGDDLAGAEPGGEVRVPAGAAAGVEHALAREERAVDRDRASRGTAPRTRGGTRRSAATASRTPTRCRAAARRGRAGRAAGCRRGSASVDRSRRRRARPVSISSASVGLESKRVARERADEIIDEAPASCGPRQAAATGLALGCRARASAPPPSAGARAGTRRASTAACGGRGGRRGAPTRAAGPRATSKMPCAVRRAGESSSCSALAQLALEPGGDRDAEALLRRGSRSPPADVRAIARLSRCFVSKRRSLRRAGTRPRNSTSSTSRNGARTSSEHAMLARSTFTRMSSCRYVFA